MSAIWMSAFSSSLVRSFLTWEKGKKTGSYQFRRIILVIIILVIIFIYVCFHRRRTSQELEAGQVVRRPTGGAVFQRTETQSPLSLVVSDNERNTAPTPVIGYD